MKQYPSNPPISTGLHDSISSTSDPPILATSAPTDSIALRERQTKVETEADQEKRRTSVPNILQTSLSSASTESVPRSPETNSGKSNNHPIDRGRRGSFREIVGTKFTSFSRRLSQQSHSPRTKSRLLSEPDFDQSQSAATLSPLFRELHRPSEWPDKTEIDYLKRKNMAEANRGQVYEEDSFEMETAGTKQPVRPALRVTIPAPRASTLPAHPIPGDIQGDRSKSAPVADQRFSGTPKRLDVHMRARSLKAMRKAHLQRSPDDWSQYDVPEAEYFCQRAQANALKSALEQMIEGKEGGGKKEIIEIDHSVEGEWFDSIEKALEAFKVAE